MYRNLHGFRANLIEWKKERTIDRAETNLSEFLEMKTDPDPALMKLKLASTLFALETLGKETYSKKVIQEDLNAASKLELGKMRRALKKIISHTREKNRGSVKKKII